MDSHTAKLLLSSEDGLVHLYQCGDRMWIDVYPTAHTRCRTLAGGVIEVAPLVSEFRVIACELARQVPQLGLTLICSAKDKSSRQRDFWKAKQAKRLKRSKANFRSR